MRNNRSALTWEEPAPDEKRQKFSATSSLVAEMKANPGRWARLGEYERDNSAQYFAKRVNAGGSLWCQPAGSFEATDRRVNGTAVVYARYVGEALEPSDLNTLIQRAAEVADKVVFDFHKLDGDEPGVTCLAWKGDVCEYATAAQPAVALAAAVAKLSAYLTGGAR